MTTPTAIPSGATLTLQCRVRHPSRRTTREYWTINARVAERGRTGTLGDFGRWATDDKASAEAALLTARLDLRTREQTTFTTFAELLAAPYTPTLSDRRLADAYDAAQESRGSERRAYRRPVGHICEGSAPVQCRVSATGSQGSCGFSGTAAEVVEHSAAVHHWHTDIATVVRTDQRYAAVQA